MRQVGITRCLAAMLLLTASIVPAAAQKTTKEDPPAQQIRLLEYVRIQAMLKNDFAVLESILAEDLIYTHSSGRVETKEEFINALRSGQTKYEAFDREGVTVRAYGDSAVVTGAAKMTVRRPNQVNNFQIRFIDVYVRRGGRWQMVAWQSTRLQP